MEEVESIPILVFFESLNPLHPSRGFNRIGVTWCELSWSEGLYCLPPLDLKVRRRRGVSPWWPVSATAPLSLALRKNEVQEGFSIKAFLGC